jgi:hypothetical protein
MPRLNVIFLAGDPSDPNTWSAALWADVPAARQTYYVNSTAKSAWSGATTTDNTNLQSGVMVEKVISQRVPPGTSIAQIEMFLQNQWSAFQSEINNYNPWVHYGSTWDGNTWTVLTNG